MSNLIHLLKPIALERAALVDLGRILVATATVEFIDATRVMVTLSEGGEVRRSREMKKGDNLEIALEVFLRNK